LAHVGEKIEPGHRQQHRTHLIHIALHRFSQLEMVRAR
jgi:hypothetical protein